MYKYFNYNHIKPKGWLLRQLLIQANGLSGNLDKIWPDIRDSAWIGGNKEGWERVPYWLDGFIPLGFLTNNKDIIKRAEKYINAILDRQQPDGWICPCSEERRATYDIWALFLIGKVLALYCEFTDDERAQTGLYKAMYCGYDLLKKEKIKLFSWGKFRWFEAFIALDFLNKKYHEDWIVELAKILREQGAEYEDYIENWKRPLNKWTLETHIVNLCMMFKAEAVCCELLGEKYESKAEKLWKILEKYNGTAVGTFTGDECLSGIANNQGTELCSVAELMYSCEQLYRITGKVIWAERLEKTTFNALPATLSDDMWTHQYDQMVNQIACIKFPGKSIFRTNYADAHLFGLEPHFGCCTANHNQAWPKLALNVFLKTNTGVLCSLMLPSELETEIKGVKVKISIDTEYPFRHYCKYTVWVEKPTDFELKIRIPKWTKSLKVNGKEEKVTSVYSIKKLWNGTETITVSLLDSPHFVSRPFGLKTVEYGPLVFSLPIKTEYKMLEYTKDDVERKFPYCDYELIPKSEWRYGFAESDFEISEEKGDDIPFSSLNPSVKLKVNMLLADWDFADGYETVSAIKPKSNKAVGNAVRLELVPYGCAKLRMTEMPIIKEK